MSPPQPESSDRALPVAKRPRSPLGSPSTPEGSSTPWQTVSKRRRVKPLNPTSTSKFIIRPSKDYESPYHVVRTLERLPGVGFLKTQLRNDGSWVVTPKDEGQRRLLQTTKEIDGKSINIELLSSGQKPTAAIVVGFPLDKDVSLLLDSPLVSNPVRCKARTGQETRQVKFFCTGPLPHNINLGEVGNFAVRAFTPDPVRCYRCQQWGHYGSSCRQPVKCGVCGMQHDTKTCIQRHHNGLTTTPNCPNCSGRHHAWNPSCRARREYIQRSAPRASSRVSGRPTEPKQTAKKTTLVKQTTKEPRTQDQQKKKRKRRTRNRQRPAPKKRIQLENRAISRSSPVPQREPESAPQPPVEDGEENRPYTELLASGDLLCTGGAQWQWSDCLSPECPCSGTHVIELEDKWLKVLIDATIRLTRENPGSSPCELSSSILQGAMAYPSLEDD